MNITINGDTGKPEIAQKKHRRLTRAERLYRAGVALNNLHIARKKRASKKKFYESIKELKALGIIKSPTDKQIAAWTGFEQLEDARRESLKAQTLRDGKADLRLVRESA